MEIADGDSDSNGVDSRHGGESIGTNGMASGLTVRRKSYPTPLGGETK